MTEAVERKAVTAEKLKLMVADLALAKESLKERESQVHAVEIDLQMREWRLENITRKLLKLITKAANEPVYEDEVPAVAMAKEMEA
jgi:hypothetical protein